MSRSTATPTPGSVEPSAPLEWGVNVAGFLRGGLGLGEAARLYVSALQAGGVPVRTTTVDVPMSAMVAPGGERGVQKLAEFQDLETDRECPFNLICVNAPELPQFYNDVGPEFFHGRRSIGVWGWEVDKVPADWGWAFEAIDEIWVYSSYVADILSRAAPVPVVRVPLPVIAPLVTDTPLDLGLPDRFTFLFLFDFFSTMQRKNPLGLIEAFTHAFAPDEGPQLLIKSFNGDYKPERLAQLRAAADGRRDVHVVDRYLTLAEKNSLIAQCDCYVSLHRAEGFGLTMAEAMALERAVIATGYSGNVDFMNPANSYLVDSTPTEVGPDGENYPPDGIWGEPDLDHAAALMREVWEDQPAARLRAGRGRADVEQGLSAQAVGRIARTRLERLSATGSGPRRAGIARPPVGSTGSVGAAERKLAFDPARQARESGGAKGLAQYAALRAMRPYTFHQDELNRALVDGLRETMDEIRETRAALLGRVGLDPQVRIDLPRMIDGYRARPASTHPLISYIDEHGRRALGFKGAVGEGGGEGYIGFEDIFRGDERLIRARQERYPALLEKAGWVLDIGCGRGEFLDILRDHGIRAKGVDVDEGMVARCREKGHDVEVADARAYLSRQADGSVPGLFAAQVIEHLPADVLTSLLALIEAKLEPGATAILETVNPHSASAMKAFWTDPTHHHPLFPEVTLALCRLAGFDSGRVDFSDPTGPFDDDVYASPDYAAVVTKRAD